MIETIFIVAASLNLPIYKQRKPPSNEGETSDVNFAL
jgi:hypothetical protein